MSLRYTTKGDKVLIKHQKDLLSGLMFTVVGGAFAIGSSEYSVGKAARMGPGYFPLVLGVVLAILGVLIALKSIRGIEHPDGRIGTLALKPLCCIIGANVLFGLGLAGVAALGIPPMGLVLAVFMLVFTASLADAQFHWRSSLVLSAILSIGSYVLFVRLLHLPFKLWPEFVAF